MFKNKQGGLSGPSVVPLAVLLFCTQYATTEGSHIYKTQEESKEGPGW